jgi:hypothetical protein
MVYRQSVDFTGMAVVRLRWPDFLSMVQTKKLAMQYVLNDDSYLVFAMDTSLVYATTLVLVDLSEGFPFDADYDKAQNDTDVTDFEETYKATANGPLEPKTQAGQPIVTTSAYAFVAEHTSFKGFLYEVEAGSHSIFDVQLTDQIYLQGGSWWIRGATKGDYLEFGVVDKDDVLGAFGPYGLTVGVDVLELGKYVRTFYPSPGDSEDTREVKAPAHVMAGLYLRLIYHSVGSTNVDISPTYYWHEV